MPEGTTLSLKIISPFSYRCVLRFLYILTRKPKGTKLVTFHALKVSIPANYQMVASYLGDTLKLWKKKY